MPIQYNLLPIQEIFTSELMHQYMMPEVLERVKQKLSEAEYRYCSHTSKTNPGLTCSNEIMNFQGVILSMRDELDESSMSNQQSCFSKCAVSTTCNAASFQKREYPYLSTCRPRSVGSGSIINFEDDSS